MKYFLGAILLGSLAVTKAGFGKEIPPGAVEVNYLIRCEDGELYGSKDLNNYLNDDVVLGYTNGNQVLYIKKPFKIVGLASAEKYQRLCVALSKN